MKPDIISKLALELGEVVHSERQVVYILAEIRKLLELESIARDEIGEPPDNSYFSLKFYCDWAVHARLTQSGATRIVARFDQYQDFMDRLHAGAAGISLDAELMTELNDQLLLSKFRQQFDRYLQKQNLPNLLTSDDKAWVNFLRYYSCVIEDAPLTCNANQLQHVDRVTVKVLDEQPSESSSYRLALKWAWASKKTGIRHNIVRFF